MFVLSFSCHNSCCKILICCDVPDQTVEQKQSLLNTRKLIIISRVLHAIEEIFYLIYLAKGR